MPQFEPAATFEPAQDAPQEQPQSARPERDTIRAPGPFAPGQQAGGQAARGGNVDDLVNSVLNRAAAAAVEAQQRDPGHGESGREAVVLEENEPFGEPVRTRADDLRRDDSRPVQGTLVRGGAEAQGEGEDGNSLAVRLTGTGAIVEHGQVSALDIEVPVPGQLVGNKRVTLQLRLTLTPTDEEGGNGGPS